jgi:hypothetical protein
MLMVTQLIGFGSTIRELIESSLGTYLDTAGPTSRALGVAAGIPIGGFFWTAPADGELRRARWTIASGADGANFHAEHWSVSGDNPSAQISVDTPGVAATNGVNTYTWATAIPIVSGTRYCCVLVSDGGDGNFTAHDNNASFGSDRDASAITSLDQTAGIDGFNNDWTVEIVVAT